PAIGLASPTSGIAMRPIRSVIAVLIALGLPNASPAQRRVAPADSLSPPPPAKAEPPRIWPDQTSWRHVGPASFGGRIDDIEAVADDPRIIFVGTASGGIFRSVNNGVTWEPVFDAFGTALSIGDIA